MSVHVYMYVAVCGMKPSKKRKGRYESFTNFSEIEVSRRDSYDTLANKAAFTVGLLEDNEGSIFLFKPVPGENLGALDHRSLPKLGTRVQKVCHLE